MHDDFAHYCSIRETFNVVAVRRRNALFFKLMLSVFCFAFGFYLFSMIVIASSRQKFEIMISLFYIHVIKQSRTLFEQFLRYNTKTRFKIINNQSRFKDFCCTHLILQTIIHSILSFFVHSQRCLQRVQ